MIAVIGSEVAGLVAAYLLSGMRAAKRREFRRWRYIRPRSLEPYAVPIGFKPHMLTTYDENGDVLAEAPGATCSDARIKIRQK